LIQWTLRELALLAVTAGASILALLPLLLALFGSRWHAGVRHGAYPSSGTKAAD